MKAIRMYCGVLLTMILFFANHVEAGVIGKLPHDNAFMQFRSGNHILGFMPGKAYVASLDHALRVEFIGAKSVMPVAEGAGAAIAGKADVLKKVVYQNLWDNISLTYGATGNGVVESIYHVAPRADVSKIRLKYNIPVEKLQDGSLSLKFASGYLSESAPVAWQDIAGKKIPVQITFNVSNKEVSFNVGKYDKTQKLMIDPVYEWHTFLGGTSHDYARCIAVDVNGNTYIAGESGKNWPTPDNYNGDTNNIVVVKLNSVGEHEWHKFYGTEEAHDIAFGIAVDVLGNVYITGQSGASWLGPSLGPGMMPKQPRHAFSGQYDIFVLKLATNGTYLWHTFYGSSGRYDIGLGIAIDSSGNSYVTARSYSTWSGPGPSPHLPWPPLHAHSGDVNGEIAVLKLNGNGDYLWHTFYGITGTDYPYGIAVDSSGDVYITGHSPAPWNGPANQPPKYAFKGAGLNTFILKLHTSGSYLWHTFYGSGRNLAYGIALDGIGNVHVVGTSGSNWTGPAGEQPRNAHNGLNYCNIFVLKLTNNGIYQWHTFYGRAENAVEDEHMGISVDAGGNVYTAGYSNATWNSPAGQIPVHAHSGGYADTFVLKLNSIGSYQWHTFYGSGTTPDHDRAFGIAVGRGNSVYVAGYSYTSWNGPAGQLPRNSHMGSDDIFVLKLKKGVPIAGDVNSDFQIDLADAIVGLKAVAGFSTPEVQKDADINNDHKIGMAEAILILRDLAESD